MIKKIIHLNIVFIKSLMFGYLCLFFTGFANVSYQYLQPNNNQEKLYCCCAGEVVEECGCNGSCCLLNSEFSLSISKRACTQSEIMDTMLIKFEFIVDPSEYLNTYPNVYNPTNNFHQSKSILFISSIEKPPQISSIS